MLKAISLFIVFSCFSFTFCNAQKFFKSVFGSPYESIDSLKLDTNCNEKILGEWFLHKIKSKIKNVDTIAENITFYENNKGDFEFGRKQFLWETRKGFIYLYPIEVVDSVPLIKLPPIPFTLEKKQLNKTCF